MRVQHALVESTMKRLKKVLWRQLISNLINALVFVEQDSEQREFRV